MKYIRGAHTFAKAVKVEIQPEKEKRMRSGRSLEVVSERNVCMLHRYYYYVRIVNLRYDLVLAELQKEFYLTYETIPRIINREIETFRVIAKRKPNPKQLERKYPNFSWSYMPKTRRLPQEKKDTRNINIEMAGM